MEDQSTGVGHEHGNFHDYYRFHPVEDRMGFFSDDFFRTVWSGRSAGTTPIRYCDLGCNEGDLTIAVYNRLACPDVVPEDVMTSSSVCRPTEHDQRGDSKRLKLCSADDAVGHPLVLGLGVDLDAELIERAVGKVSSTCSKLAGTAVKFVAADLSASGDETLEVFLAPNASNDAPSASSEVQCSSEIATSSEECTELHQPMSPRPRFALVTCFSVTMWVHLHAGDEGLRAFLRRAAASADCLVVEPQPWKCYRNACRRLRRLGLPAPPFAEQLFARRQREPSMDITKEIDRFLCGEEEQGDNPNASSDRSVFFPRSGRQLLGTNAWGRSIIVYTR